MIYKSKHGGERELRTSFEWGSTSPPRYGANWLSHAGEIISLDSAVSVPAALGAILMTAEAIGSMPMLVYRGRGDERERAVDTWQWELLHENPSGPGIPGVVGDPVSFMFDIAQAVEGTGNGLVRKYKVRGKVVALEVLRPHVWDITVDRDTGEIVYRSGETRLAADEIIHVRGPAIGGGPIGMSPVGLARHALGSALAKERFEGRFYLNNARPGLVFTFPSEVGQESARRWLDLYEQEHAGPDNAAKPTVLGGGADVKVVPINLQDAQFLESQNYSVLQIARMFRIPASLLDAQMLGTHYLRDDMERWYKVGLLPRIRRIESAFAADHDLFGGREANDAKARDLYPEILADALLRVDIQTRYAAWKDARQGSWITANEIRRAENLPPVEGGDEIQITPVGGAPNPPNPATAAAEE